MRRLHFVGSLPQFADPAGALDWQLGELRGEIVRVTGGETGPRLQWFVPMVKELARSPRIRVLRSGDWTGYDDTDLLAVRRGAALRPADIPLRVAEYAEEELSALDGRGPATPPLQVGVPGYVDMALFTFGPAGALRVSRTFLRAMAEQIARIHDRAGDRVVFQLETPAALIALLRAPRILRPPLARLLARIVTRQVAAAPDGARFGVHLCLGDLGHRAARGLRTAEPVVELANAIHRSWPAGRSLEFMHLPMSGGDDPPVTDPAFYRPLRDLEVTVPVVAGIAHERQDRADQLTVRRLFEESLGRPADIATSCGLGRRTPEQAGRAVTAMRTLLPD